MQNKVIIAVIVGMGLTAMLMVLNARMAKEIDVMIGQTNPLPERSFQNSAGNGAGDAGKNSAVNLIYVNPPLPVKTADSITAPAPEAAGENSSSGQIYEIPLDGVMLPI